MAAVPVPALARDGPSFHGEHEFHGGHERFEHGRFERFHGPGFYPYPDCDCPYGVCAPSCYLIEY
jgi:hypothetical protein